MMHRIIPRAGGYFAAFLVVPLFFAVTQYQSPIRLPFGFGFISLGGLYLILAFTAFVVALPGFVIAQLILRWTSARSAASYLVLGAVTGLLSAVFLTYPNTMVLATNEILLIAVVIGLGGGLVSWQPEVALRRLLAGRTQSGTVSQEHLL
jgi:hypothetical protein